MPAVTVMRRRRWARRVRQALLGRALMSVWVLLPGLPLLYMAWAIIEGR